MAFLLQSRSQEDDHCLSRVITAYLPLTGRRVANSRTVELTVALSL